MKKRRYRSAPNRSVCIVEQLALLYVISIVNSATNKMNNTLHWWRKKIHSCLGLQNVIIAVYTDTLLNRQQDTGNYIFVSTAWGLCVQTSHMDLDSTLGIDVIIVQISLSYHQTSPGQTAGYKPQFQDLGLGELGTKDIASSPLPRQQIQMLLMLFL